ncbi:trem-like transcript 4 protein isoform X3 [Marmota marmota marmota]|uniref:trem-like transcript 4 protein isoform X3 n=1 Tax=Marmota marmota marmota TaxID=9994 RepID=UPI000762AE7B|nr:trem-like transcript 4 protein isoform X3 [Marmota marmota marmota]
MAWEGLRLLMHPVALVLLVPGSWGLAVTPEELREVVGGTLLVQCWSSPQEGPYMQKTWCRQRSPGRCTRLVTTSQPLTAVENAQHTIWDHPKAGFFIVTMTQLREEDLGVYLCGSFNSSQNLINTFRNITLVVSPALITSPEGTSSPSVNGSEQGESGSSSFPGPASPELLLSVQYGLLLAKGLVLFILCVLLSFWRPRGRRTWLGQ